MWDKIKKILQKEGGKCIIIEENQPAYVVLTFDEYEKKINDSGSVDNQFEKVNRDIAEWKATETESFPEPSITEEQKEEDVKIEDLPF